MLKGIEEEEPAPERQAEPSKPYHRVTVISPGKDRDTDYRDSQSGDERRGGRFAGTLDGEGS